MTEVFEWGDLGYLIPLGILGLIRWISWLFRRLPAVAYRPYVSSHRASISVVTPVYQEDPEMFRAALESWLDNEVNQVICVIDETDLACLAIAEDYPVTVIITSVPGKRDALRRGWEAARSEIVALVDSDTIWAPDVADRVLEPFADPGIGGVGTRQNVHRPRGFWQRISDMYLDYRYFDENASQTVMGQAVSCLSGRTAVYRRDLLLEVSDDFMDETFMGRRCNSGEDKRLTTLILERGWRTYMQRSARVWSTFPARPGEFFKQRLRWARNTWRSDLRALGRRWVWRHPFLAFCMVDKGVSNFTLLVAPVFFTLALVRADYLFTVALAVWWLVSRGLKMLPHLARVPRDLIILPGYVLLTFAMALVKIYALTTIKTQKWLTRDVEVSGSEAIIRTSAA